MNKGVYHNPYRPGAGHFPPYLAGRENEINELSRLLGQDVILKNAIITGLRGVGKTVLLDAVKPVAMKYGWLWVGADLTESASLSEDNFATRLIADLSSVTSSVSVSQKTIKSIGFNAPRSVVSQHLDYQTLVSFYNGTPGLSVDKLKAVLQLAWATLRPYGVRGIVFAYDEAQNMSDQAKAGEYPLSALLDSFQSIQKMSIPFMLVLTGLPTLFPKLVEARTYAERMFRIVQLARLEDEAAAMAVKKPLDAGKSAIKFPKDVIERIVHASGGYPYFVQFLSREVFDSLYQSKLIGNEFEFPETEIVRKLDVDFYWGRYNRMTDRQRELVHAVAQIELAGDEFSFQDVVDAATSHMKKVPSPSQLTAMLNALIESGLLFKQARGKYSFAIPMMRQFLLRQI